MTTAREHLLRYGIRPSVQRVAVMDYLLKNTETHPTVEDIYTALVVSIPTLSRTTVYNTLHLLYNHGAVFALCIDGINAHFDGYIYPHAHFMCNKCGKIYNVKLDDVAFMDRNTPQDAAFVNDAQLYYKGVCQECNMRKDK